MIFIILIYSTHSKRESQLDIYIKYIKVNTHIINGYIKKDGEHCQYDRSSLLANAVGTRWAKLVSLPYTKGNLGKFYTLVVQALSCVRLLWPCELWPTSFSVHGISQASLLERVAIFFSRGSFQPRNQTQVSCIAGRFFTNWAMRDPQTLYTGGPKILTKDSKLHWRCTRG